MSTITDIERAVLELRPEELAQFRRWFAEYDGASWDRQIKRDAVAGRLDVLADKALDELHRGRRRS